MKEKSSFRAPSSECNVRATSRSFWECSEQNKPQQQQQPHACPTVCLSVRSHFLSPPYSQQVLFTGSGAGGGLCCVSQISSFRFCPPLHARHLLRLLWKKKISLSLCNDSGTVVCSLCKLVVVPATVVNIDGTALSRLQVKALYCVVVVIVVVVACLFSIVLFSSFTSTRSSTEPFTQNTHTSAQEAASFCHKQP